VTSAEWTPETLKEHYDAILEQMDRAFSAHVEAAQEALEAALDAALRAVDKAEKDQERKNIEQSASLREMKDQSADFMTRELFDQRIKEIIDRVEALKSISATDKESIGKEVTDLTLAITRKVSQESFDTLIGELRRNQEAHTLLIQNRVTSTTFEAYQDGVRKADAEYRNREADARTQANRNTVGIIVAVLIAAFSGIITLVTNLH
jgi:hypothetical protein